MSQDIEVLFQPYRKRPGTSAPPMDFRSASTIEVAEWLNLSVPAVNSALQRARRALHQLQEGSEAPLALPSPHVQDLLDRYVALWEQADIPGLVALLREDAWFTMPPIPAWFQGRAAIATLLSTRIFTPSRHWRLLPTRANGSPAFGLYQREAGAVLYQLFGLVVLGVEDEQIASLVAFLGVRTFLAPLFPAKPEEIQAEDGKEVFSPRKRLRNIRQLTLPLRFSGQTSSFCFRGDLCVPSESLFSL